jgi:hypothetical protein
LPLLLLQHWVWNFTPSVRPDAQVMLERLDVVTPIAAGIVAASFHRKIYFNPNNSIF